MMFERNYLSRMIRYNTQDAYWGRTPDNDSARTASRIGRLRDPKRPRKLTELQGRRARREPRVLKLCSTRGRIRTEIELKYCSVRMAEGEPIHVEYETLGRSIISTIRAEEHALLKRIQEEYDATAPVAEIQRQLNEELLDEDDTPDSVIHFKSQRPYYATHQILKARVSSIMSTTFRS
ncbi:hypothetical protein Egran_01255 [Elaphomyces granulatus]|uniref:Uncharacterized protein n=1 Tax=Elaphomyces granulatus TaxID=519963 RepID=A0A232M3V9_9EURO|nr:hypothetical protein Egran_01255 [Elaphomyces granulatus]